MLGSILGIGLSYNAAYMTAGIATWSFMIIYMIVCGTENKSK